MFCEVMSGKVKVYWFRLGWVGLVDPGLVRLDKLG